MAQSEETIRRRIDALGLTEPVVAPYGQADNEIVVELPGEADPNRAKNVIQAGGQLELRKGLFLSTPNARACRDLRGTG